jgi:hypothetical protein
MVGVIVYIAFPPAVRGCLTVYVVVDFGIFMTIVASTLTHWRLRVIFGNSAMTAVAITEKKMLFIFNLVLISHLIVSLSLSVWSSPSLYFPIREDVNLFDGPVCRFNRETVFNALIIYMIVTLLVPVVMSHYYCHMVIKVNMK